MPKWLTERAQSVIEGREPGETLAHVITRDPDWQKGFKTLTDRAIDAGFARPLAAAEAAPSEMTAGYQNLKERERKDIALLVSTPAGLPRDEVVLHVAQEDNDIPVTLNGLPRKIPNNLQNDKKIILAASLVEPGLIGRNEKPWTRPVELDPATIRTEGGVETNLMSALKDPQIPQSLALKFERVSKPRPLAPRLLRADGTNRVITYQGEIGSSIDPIDKLIIPAAGPMTYALIWGDRGLMGSIFAIRSDEPALPIGTYHQSVPMLAAASDKWASLEIFIGPPKATKGHYTVLATSGTGETSRNLLLTLFGKIAQPSSTDAPLSPAQLLTASRWACQVLDPEFNPDLIAGLDGDLRRKIKDILAPLCRSCQ